MAKKKKSEKDTEKVCEVFEIGKKGKEKLKKTCDTIEKKHASKEQEKKQNKTLRNILIGLLVIVLLIIGLIYIFYSANHFSYRGITGEVVKDEGILFYKIGFPVRFQGQIVPYYIYIRNNPESLDNIPFEGEIDFGEKFPEDNAYRLVINMSDEFDCEGDQAISIGNMLNLKALGIKVVRDENATCDSEGRYMFIDIKKGEESKIMQVENSCYDLVVKECEILKVTERFMVEAFVKYYSE